VLEQPWRASDPLLNKLVDADPSFITTQQNAKRLQGYGLTLEQWLATA